MKSLCLIFLTVTTGMWAANSADSDAIRKAISTFNDTQDRASVLTPDADILPLEPFVGQCVSQVYFEARAIRFITPSVAFVDATASQFGSLTMKRSSTAMFVLKREEGEWRIAVMRAGGFAMALGGGQPRVEPVLADPAAVQSRPSLPRK
jgi:hypothetical protein